MPRRSLQGPRRRKTEKQEKRLEQQIEFQFITPAAESYTRVDTSELGGALMCRGHTWRITEAQAKLDDKRGFENRATICLKSENSTHRLKNCFVFSALCHYHPATTTTTTGGRRGGEGGLGGGRGSSFSIYQPACGTTTPLLLTVNLELLSDC